MKTFYLIRHAKSSWEDMDTKDIDRPLNKRGFRDAPFMAQLLKGKGVKIDRIISSPANRAYTTATYFAEALDIEKDKILVKKEIYEAYTDEMIALIKSLDDAWNSVLLFGHNPSFTSLANQFADTYIVNVPTCGVIRIDAPVNSWAEVTESNARVSEYYFPKQYFS